MDLGTGLLYFVFFIFSTTVHEAAHAWTAKKLGDLTAYAGGQVTLNPLPHIQRHPFGMVLVPIIGIFLLNFPIGWASAPLNAYWADRYPHKAAKVALAGPLSNLILLIIGTLFIQLLYFEPITQALVNHGKLFEDLLNFFFIFARLNLILFVLNLIPFPPLDGSEAILLLYSRQNVHHIRARLQSIGMFGLLFAIMVFNFVYPFVEALWMKLIT